MSLRAPGHAVQPEGNGRSQGQDIPEQHPAGEIGLKSGQNANPQHGDDDSAPLAPGNRFMQKDRRKKGDKSGRGVNDSQRMGDGGEGERGNVKQKMQRRNQSKQDKFSPLRPRHAPALPLDEHHHTHRQGRSGQPPESEFIARDGIGPADEDGAGGKKEDRYDNIQQSHFCIFRKGGHEQGGPNRTESCEIAVQKPGGDSTNDVVLTKCAGNQRENHRQYDQCAQNVPNRGGEIHFLFRLLFVDAFATRWHNRFSKIE